MHHKKIFNKDFLIRFSILIILILIPNIFYFFIMHEKRLTTVLINNLFLISISILLLKNSFTKVLGYLFVLIFALNNSIQLFSLFYYKTTFNVGMAMSFLSSN